MCSLRGIGCYWLFWNQEVVVLSNQSTTINGKKSKSQKKALNYFPKSQKTNFKKTPNTKKHA
jgi:hypothetical protein